MVSLTLSYVEPHGVINTELEPHGIINTELESHGVINTELDLTVSLTLS